MRPTIFWAGRCRSDIAARLERKRHGDIHCSTACSASDRAPNGGNTRHADWHRCADIVAGERNDPRRADWFHHSVRQCASPAVHVPAGHGAGKYRGRVRRVDQLRGSARFGRSLLDTDHGPRGLYLGFRRRTQRLGYQHFAHVRQRELPTPVRLTVTNKQGISAFISHRSRSEPAPPAPMFHVCRHRPPLGRRSSSPPANDGWARTRDRPGTPGTSETALRPSPASTSRTCSLWPLIHSVTLTVVDDSGQQASTSATVPVGTGAPTANFTAPVTGTHTMSFDASASTAQCGATITQYQWSFGDGSFGGPSDAPSISHTFVAAGTYRRRCP